ncbi:arylesterase [Qipengyuania sp. 6B39]|uniref:arylesterase n=1 Tax=Qipengyuania proteolytica TaxID=2867239 RepID=UPI001C895B72|nr:arylesterase [Qipengyuania proteolytica]MBX7495328.1 arylesterase [Qipengyuania proteolytica]
MRLYHLSIPLLALALAGCGAEPEGAAPAEQSAEVANARPDIVVEGPERHILAFGDSLFAGYGIGRENSYPALLEDALRAQGINARITNAGISGETSGAGAQRLAFALDAQEVKPDLVILELGGNDMLRGLQPDQTRANFEKMLAELTKRDIPVLLMGMRAPPNYGPEYQRAFDGLYGELAQQYGARLIPFWLEAIYQNPALFQADRIHPTVEGIEVLVEDTAAEVAQALPKEG